MGVSGASVTVQNNSPGCIARDGRSCARERGALRSTQALEGSTKLGSTCPVTRNRTSCSHCANLEPEQS